MKTAILIIAVIVGYTAPTYSQVNRHRKIDARPEQFQNTRNVDFGNYKFTDKLSGSLSEGFDWSESFNMYTIRPEPEMMHSPNDMPVAKPTGHYIRSFKPDGYTQWKSGNQKQITAVYHVSH